MNEADTRAKLIDPALRTTGWGIVEDSRIRREAIDRPLVVWLVEENAPPLNMLI